MDVLRHWLVVPFDAEAETFIVWDAQEAEKRRDNGARVDGPFAREPFPTPGAVEREAHEESDRTWQDVHIEDRETIERLTAEIERLRTELGLIAYPAGRDLSTPPQTIARAVLESSPAPARGAVHPRCCGGGVAGTCEDCPDPGAVSSSRGLDEERQDG